MINVFVDNFIHPNEERAAEISRCIDLNKSNTNFNYHLLNSPERMSYQSIFNRINEQTLGDNVNVIANIDIYFDETVLLLNKIGENQFVAISRYESESADLDPQTAKYSQDVWAWKGRVRIENANFYLGVLGCDNRIAAEAQLVGYEVINPSFSIRIYHYHTICSSNDEYYNRVPGPYMNVFPQTWT
ncbi:hypothetical protein M0R72_02735 [Candidatus Pacearchaeota archaeon]|jgi:hypothetical protein|nr:hypothetical protein [Candidatus Pacearchaeota archaeon]